jgi:TolA-binding protein
MKRLKSASTEWRLGFLSDALALMKMRQYLEAAKLMQSHLNDHDIIPSAKIGLMSWIGECYAKAENKSEAGHWYEEAARAALACKTIPESEKIRKAKDELEVALAHYEAINDRKGMGRVASLKYGLNS